MRGGSRTVGDKHGDDEHESPESERNLDFTEQMPEAGMCRSGMRQMFEECRRKRVQDRDGEQQGSDQLNGGWRHTGFRMISLRRRQSHERRATASSVGPTLHGFCVPRQCCRKTIDHCAQAEIGTVSGLGQRGSSSILMRRRATPVVRAAAATALATRGTTSRSKTLGII